MRNLKQLCMGKTLPHCFFIKTVLFTALLLGIAVQGTYSQSNADIAYAGFNGDFNVFDYNISNIVQPPTVAFSTTSLSVDENAISIDLTVELVEANSTSVDVDVAFLPGSSTASASDIGNYSTQTVSFSSNDSDGAVKTVTVTLTDDNNFEGSEKAVFQLRNITVGSVITPGELTLTIVDDDAPNIVFNEILYEPTADANGDGNTDISEDEFIELVNNGSEDIDISNWTLSDNSSVIFTFPSGSVIPAGNAAVVFADTAEGNSFGGASLFLAGSLGLNKRGGQITLANANSDSVTGIVYSGSESEQSVTRSPDISGGFEGHTAADADDDSSPFSPGTKINGTPFGSKHAIAIRGSEGWRMISSPVEGATFTDFFNEFWTQGLTGSDDPAGQATIYSWSESNGGAFATPANMTDNLEPGKGYLVYFFEDNDLSTPGIQGGFPKVVDSDGAGNNGSVNIDVSSTDANGSSGIDGNEGWNMLGNPFDTDLSVSAVIDALQSVNPSVNENIYVWDHDAAGGNGDWIALTDGDLIAPFQGFFVRYTSSFNSTNVSFDKNSLEANSQTEFYKNEAGEFSKLDLSLHGDQYFDTYSLEFKDEGSLDLDQHDGYHLSSLDQNSISLFSTLSNNRLEKNVLPRDLESTLEIPLVFDAGDRETLTFRWKNIESLPVEWKFTLIDKEMNREIDLRSSDEYKFNRVVNGKQQSPLNEETLLNKSNDEDQESRFVLSVQPKQAQKSSTGLPDSIKLNPNYPNPFNPQTTIPYEITKETEVKLTIWNMIGQKVATLVDGIVEAGQHEETWNASSMPSGIYIARFEVGGKVFTRKMTLIK